MTDVRPATESVGRDPQAGQCAAEKPSCAAAAKPSGRWLTAAEMDSWVNLAQMLMLLPAALDRQLREDAGIPHAYYQILAMLSAEPGRSMRMTDLARIVGSTTSRLSHAVASLEQRGWVRRQACPSDKRGQVACLTEAGTAALKEAAPGHVAEVRRLVFDHLTAEDVGAPAGHHGEAPADVEPVRVTGS